MPGPRRRFRRDDEGVSEVIGYILSFAIAFMILVASMATFQIISNQGTRLAAGAEFRDIANRVAAAVLESFEVGSAVRQTFGEVDSSASSPLVYSRSLDIPTQFRGFSYSIELNDRFVFVNSTDGSLRPNSTTFKADVVLASPSDPCMPKHVVCSLGGRVAPGSSRVVVTYTYDTKAYDPDVPGSLINEITIG